MREVKPLVYFITTFQESHQAVPQERLDPSPKQLIELLV